MSTNKTWPSTGVINVTPTTYSIPQAGNLNWATLTDFLVALANGAQSTTFQRYATRAATTTPVTVSTNDCAISVELASPAATTVNLPAGVDKQVFYIADGTGDANTNNITINPDSGETIAGQSSLVLNSDGESVMLAFQSSDTDWKVIANAKPNPTGGDIGGFTINRAIISNGTGFLTTSTTTATEIGYVNGVTSSIQTQLNAKADNPLTTTGDIIYASNTATPATPARLGIGSTNTVLVVAGGIPTWNTIDNASISASAGIAVNKLAALTISRAVVTDSSGFIAAATTTATEIGYVNGVTSSIQTQLNARTTNPMTTTGDLIYASNTATPATAARLGIGADNTVLIAASGVPTWNTIANASISSGAAIAVNKLAALTVSRAVVTDGSGFISAATTTATEIGFVNGVTSSIQTQLNGKQATGNYITALTGDVTASGPGSAAATLTATTNATITTLSALTTAASLATVGTITSGTWSATTIAVNKGGTGVTSVTTAPTATAFAGWDANSNLSANSHISGYATTATGGTTTTLTVASKQLQYFTGSTTQTVVLPVTSTLVLGQSFTIINNSSGNVTVQSSGANTVQVMGTGSYATYTCILTSGTTAASWNVQYSTSAAGTVTSVAMTVPTFLSVSGSPVTTTGTLAVTLSGTALPILNGGTGSTTATGSGSVVLATSPTLVTPVLGVASGTSLALSGVLSSAAYTNTVATGATNATFVSGSTGVETIATFRNSTPTTVGALITDGTGITLTGATTNFGLRVDASGANLAKYDGTVGTDLQLGAYNNSTTTSPLYARCTNSGSGTLPILTVRKDVTASATPGALVFIRFESASGTSNGIIANANATTLQFSTPSDKRLKSEITPIQRGLDLVTALNPVKFKINGNIQSGFIAQEMAEVLPEFVTMTDNGTDDLKDIEKAWSISSPGYVTYLVAAIKELSDKVKQLEARIG